MKIIKEVIIKANINDAWSWLTSDETMQGFLYPLPDGKHSPDLGQVSVIKADPPFLLSFSGGGLTSDIVTTFELSDRNIRTSLKVTVSGWETIDSKSARIEMPQLSLAWEKKLNLLKKSIESIALHRDKA